MCNTPVIPALLACVAIGGCAGIMEPHPYGGSFTGIYQTAIPGRDHGTWHINVTDQGDVLGVAHSNRFDLDFAVVGSIATDGGVAMGAGAAASGATFEGTVDDEGRLKGTWSNPRAPTLYYGTFEGGRAEIPFDPRSLSPRGG